MAHHPAWVGHHTGGFRSTPTVHPCPLRSGGCGWLTGTPTHNESKKTQHNNNMVAEQVLRDLSVRRASVVRSLGAQISVSMECADVPDVSNTVRSDDLSNVASRAEALRQCKLGFSTDKMVGDNKVLSARCRWNGTASVSAECQYSVNCVGSRCGSHGVCLDKATPTVVHVNDHTCECDSGFELKSTARVVAYQLPSTMLGTCSRMPLRSRKLSSTSVMCSACRVSSVTVESRRGICRKTSGARSREHCAMRAIRSQRTLPLSAPAEQKALHSGMPHPRKCKMRCMFFRGTSKQRGAWSDRCVHPE